MRRRIKRLAIRFARAGARHPWRLARLIATAAFLDDIKEAASSCGLEFRSHMEYDPIHEDWVTYYEIRSPKGERVYYNWV